MIREWNIFLKLSYDIIMTLLPGPWIISRERSFIYPFITKFKIPIIGPNFCRAHDDICSMMIHTYKIESTLYFICMKNNYWKCSVLFMYLTPFFCSSLSLFLSCFWVPCHPTLDLSITSLCLLGPSNHYKDITNFLALFAAHAALVPSRARGDGLLLLAVVALDQLDGVQAPDAKFVFTYLLTH